MTLNQPMTILLDSILIEVQIYYSRVKPVHVVISIKQPPMLKGHPFSCPVIEDFK